MSCLRFLLCDAAAAQKGGEDVLAQAGEGERTALPKNSS